jgi:hypothetical protein
MSFLDVTQMANDRGLQSRVKSCLVLENMATPGKYPDSDIWIVNHAWVLAAQPGWQEAWGYARAQEKTNLGLDEGVVTDGMISAAAEAIYQFENIVSAETDEPNTEGDAA